jgi:hypothetical protein
LSNSTLHSAPSGARWTSLFTKRVMAIASNRKSLVNAHRRRLKARGLRPIQIWVPDVCAPGFKAEAHRQSLAVATSRQASEDQSFMMKCRICAWTRAFKSATKSPYRSAPSTISRTTQPAMSGSGAGAEYQSPHSRWTSFGKGAASAVPSRSQPTRVPLSSHPEASPPLLYA